ncbi:protein LONG AFTER FAR-RED 3 isoform X2 [Humulus lupulus]|uniref:protein LONG AFTER FAR-RED 3 isoform X2 n=1 Tax=Humulus lupulus TaxID=3486 RepID=UPI002B40E7A0|nr:protein LONG AFTER FAR-RED 3 isoform X2 [Humulus lupulus]
MVKALGSPNKNEIELEVTILSSHIAKAMKPSSFIWVWASLAILLLAIIASFPSKWSSSSMAADLLLTNALIFTSDDSIPFADSMAIGRGRILRVGNYSSLKALVGYSTKELNLNGKIVVPGFIDSHVHLISGGLQLMRLQFRGINKKDEFVRRIAEAAENRKPGSWILGGGWNNDLWGGDLPTASWIDDITPNNPVWLPRTDGHMGLANSVALKFVRIDNSSKDPDGGAIMRTASGVPTGLLIDSAMKLVVSYIPELSIDERREALQRASSLALMKGVTTVVDIGRYFPGTSVDRPWEDFSDVYQWADSSRKMRVRVCLFFPLETWSRLHPYVDEPENYGLQVADYEKLFNMTLAADNHRLQVAIHAIGDRANDRILDMYESIISKNGIRDRRFRIEHAQHLAPGTADRFGELGIIASVQPEHLLYDFESATKKLGFDRAQKGSYLFGSLLSGNATLAFGSDWPVADINPLGSIRTAMTRKSPAWESAWNPYESILMNDALKAHTISAARACFLDKDIGSISPGKLADFVVLSTDSWDEFASVGSASVEATYVAGIQVYP